MWVCVECKHSTFNCTLLDIWIKISTNTSKLSDFSIPAVPWTLPKFTCFQKLQLFLNKCSQILFPNFLFINMKEKNSFYNLFLYDFSTSTFLIICDYKNWASFHKMLHHIWSVFHHDLSFLSVLCVSVQNVFECKLLSIAIISVVNI